MAGLTRRDAMALAGATAMAAPLAAASPPKGPWTGGGDIATIGGKLRYATLGPERGVPLVLLAKLGGWIADWDRIAPLLAENRRLIAIDLPGHGGSRMDGPPPFMVTVPEIAGMIGAALDQLGVDRFAIAGNSIGAIVGMVMAACQPKAVDRLIIVSASMIGAMTRAEVAAQDRAMAKPDAPSAYAPNGQPLPPTPEQIAAFGTMDPSVTEEMARSRAAAGLWVRPCERGVARVGVTDYLPRIQAPTLLINADRGRYAKYREVGLKLIPGAKSVVIPEAGSFVHQEKPRETAAAIDAFMG